MTSVKSTSSVAHASPHHDTSSLTLDFPLTFQPIPYAPSVNLPEPYPENTTFPLALTPTSPHPPIDDIVTAIKSLSGSGAIRSLLTQHGAIYFSGLGLSTADEFSQFASAIGWTPHEDIGNPVRRTVHAFNVATANEGPNTKPVYPHNEFGLSPHYPAYVLFYCFSEPETGMPFNSD